MVVVLPAPGEDWESLCPREEPVPTASLYPDSLLEYQPYAVTSDPSVPDRSSSGTTHLWHTRLVQIARSKRLSWIAAVVLVVLGVSTVVVINQLPVTQDEAESAIAAMPPPSSSSTAIDLALEVLASAATPLRVPPTSRNGGNPQTRAPVPRQPVARLTDRSSKTTPAISSPSRPLSEGSSRTMVTTAPVPPSSQERVEPILSVRPAATNTLITEPSGSPFSRSASVTRVDAAAAAVSSSPSSPSSDATISDTAAIESLLSRYRLAFAERDVSAVEAFWPSVNSRALGNAFDQLRMQKFDFDECHIDVTGARANAVCGGTASFVPRVGSRYPRVEPRRWTFHLARNGQAWIMERIETR
jgi:hypothetical protein